MCCGRNAGKAEETNPGSVRYGLTEAAQGPKLRDRGNEPSAGNRSGYAIRPLVREWPRVPWKRHAGSFARPEGKVIMFAVLDFFPDFCIIFAACSLAVGGASATVLFRKRDAARLLRIEEKLDLILRRADLAYTPSHDLPEEALEALRDGKEEAAAKLYQAAKGIGLDEAKKYVDEVKKAGAY